MAQSSLESECLLQVEHLSSSESGFNLHHTLPWKANSLTAKILPIHSIDCVDSIELGARDDCERIDRCSTLHEKIIFKYFVHSWYATKNETRDNVMTLLNNINDKFIQAHPKIEERQCTDSVSTFAVINSYMCHALKRTSFVASHQMAQMQLCDIFHFHPHEYANPYSLPTFWTHAHKNEIDPTRDMLLFSAREC